MADGACKKCLKILVLHGYRQNAQTCREKLGAFRKCLKKLPLEFDAHQGFLYKKVGVFHTVKTRGTSHFIYITAPNRIPNNSGSDCNKEQESNEYGWWFSSEDDSYDPLTPSDVCKGYNKSIELVNSTFITQGPFDGVLGFSQGACLLSILCALREQGSLDFNFAILVAGFKSRSSVHKMYYNTPMSCPSLQVFGDTDRVIPKENSEDLLKHFVNPVSLNHPGGHFVPTQASQKKVYSEFLEQFLNKT